MHFLNHSNDDGNGNGNDNDNGNDMINCLVWRYRLVIGIGVI